MNSAEKFAKSPFDKRFAIFPASQMKVMQIKIGNIMTELIKFSKQKLNGDLKKYY